MDLEKLITTNPIGDFFTETFDLLSARPFENLVRRGGYGFCLSLEMVMKRWSVEGGRKVVLVPQNCFYWGAATPQTPCCSWGASSLPDPLAGGLQPPVPPCIPRGSASRAVHFFWYQDLGTRILVPRFTMGSQVHDGFWEEVKAARSAALNF